VNSVCSVGPPTPPVDLCKSVQSVGELFCLRGVYPPTEQTDRDVLPQISQILTDVVFLEFCEFCVFCGTSHAPVNLCKSVQSVGGLFSTLLQNRLAEMFSHRIHRIHRTDRQRVSSHGIHRIDWQRMSSHRFHRFSQMVCVWSSVNSVCSVRPPTPPVDLCKSVQSVGGLFLVAWVIALLVSSAWLVSSALLVHLRQVHPLCAPPIIPYRATKAEGFTPRSR